ncbi:MULTISPECIES: hypothetical protein [unclassified Streptomyces]|uniref:hypothetical protein n=1 Tax=unclassified Streptomyces TaxID=2593676 RepID=UPI0007007625|nr:MULTISPECIES: hypothetical protein [unclassified Streptomyces]KQX55792.1 hypothetical protein ASD33_30940 [Streptomyces sp. Root1304]KRA96389.1 hypothetical protein ASE09_27705 [Streptomyces sp. Root66D1]
MTAETDEVRARAFLWELQAQIAQARGGRTVAGERWEGFLVEAGKGAFGFSEEKVRQVVELGAAGQAHWPPRGPDEHPGGYMVIHMLADQLEASFDGSFPRPVLGMMATGEINALTLLAPGSQTHLVVFEDELLNFANLFSKAVALAMPYEDAEDGGIAFSVDIDRVRSHVRESPEAVRRFREVVLGYLLEGRPSAAPQYFPPEAVATMGGILRDGMELFVLGHEYGHVMAEHVADRQSPRRLLGTEEGEVTEVGWKWEQEVVADLLGWNLCLEAMYRNHGAALAHAGVELFFSACEVLDRAVPLLVTGTNAPRPQSPTHPPAELRRDLVRTHTQARLEENAAPLLELGAAIQEIVDILWEQTAPLILDLHRRGVVPDARWTANLQGPTDPSPGN